MRLKFTKDKIAQLIARLNLIDLATFCLIYIFLLAFFDPRLLFSATITAGGDTGSHYYAAVYLRDYLLPHGKIMGWLPGNYAGFPLFYHYFPFPFLLIVLLGYLVTLPIAFKLVTVLGTFLLPLAVYYFFRRLKYPFPIPVCGAILTLPFLFMEANSMWGANIPSTLAGEFSYSLGISLLFFFFGSLYSGIENNKRMVVNGCLIALMALCHGYAVIFSVIIGSYFLWDRTSFRRNLWYLFRVFGLGLLLSAFWLVPFFFTLPYVTEYVTAWQIKSPLEVVPPVLWPGLALSLAALFFNRRDRRTAYFAYCFGIGLVFYFLGPRIGLLDIRFIPVLQILFATFGATLLLPLKERLKQPELLPAIVLLATIIFTSANVTYIKGWIGWNYSGFEGKKSWPLFQQINAYLRQSGPGRVAYEHSLLHNDFGTERAFESLPFFAGRETLEGLYMQSSVSSPFIFYLQSLYSKNCSAPFPQYTYGRLNLAAALPRLELFNVVEYLARSPEAKAQAAKLKELRLEKTFGDYNLYRITTSSGRYVVPLDEQPLAIRPRRWKQAFFEWFISSGINGPLLARTASLEGAGHYQPLKKVMITEKFAPEEIVFTTSHPGYPHLIKVSYHPNWQVTGAKKIYLVSPSFMLVYPERPEVKLTFRPGWPEWLGLLLTLTGIFAAIFGIIAGNGRNDTLSHPPGQ
ncbi:MAG: 6-pyruvoyl-tetrahydropterin synthase-related protein [Candidatus Margulisiibacteriota bacterium]